LKDVNPHGKEVLATMAQPKIRIIGDVINNAYGRARKAWSERSFEKYQAIVKSQDENGVEAIDVNIDGTQTLQVRAHEMVEFLPELVPALQEVTTTALCFDNPGLEFHKAAFGAYDRSKGGKPILNSLAASREQLEEMMELAAQYDSRVIVMASEQFVDGQSTQCFKADEVYRAAKYFVELLNTKYGRVNDDIIVDPGLAPVGADTYGLVNMGLDAMRLIRQDPDLAGVHFSVGLTNFAWGTPKGVRHQLERAYLTLGAEAGLDMALANPAKDPQPLDRSDPMVAKLEEALEAGRPRGEESQEEAGFRQAEKVLACF